MFDAGANVDRANLKGWTALMIAAQQGHMDMVDLLLGKGILQSRMKS